MCVVGETEQYKGYKGRNASDAWLFLDAPFVMKRLAKKGLDQVSIYRPNRVTPVVIVLTVTVNSKDTIERCSSEVFLRY